MTQHYSDEEIIALLPKTGSIKIPELKRQTGFSGIGDRLKKLWLAGRIYRESGYAKQLHYSRIKNNET